MRLFTKMPRLAMALAVAGLTAWSASAYAQRWERKVYAQDGFSVEFSGPVKIEPTDTGAEAKDRIDRSTNYLQDNGPSAFLIGATLTRHSVEFDKGAEASFNAMKCKIKLKDEPLNFSRGRAREMLGTNCTDDGSLRVEARYYTVGKWFYQVLAIYKTDSDAEAARRFVTSFEVLAN